MIPERLQIGGTPAAMGRTHGSAYRDDIARFAAERVAAAGDARWIGTDVSRADVLALAEACLPAHHDYAPALFTELAALAEAAGLSTAEALIVSGFTDFLDTAHAVFGAGAAPASPTADQCTAMMVPPQRSATGGPLFAQTWDMHESATAHVVMLDGRPDDAPRFKLFTSRGCLGMIGMNEAGITVGINNLSGADGRHGVTWNFVVREVLAGTTFAAARRALDRAPLAGAHNYLLMAPSGEGINVEATATTRVVTTLTDTPIVHTNHCMAEATRRHERQRLAASQRSSSRRLARAQSLLADSPSITIDTLAAITRDTNDICYPPTPLYGMTTCGAVLADPTARRLWALRGRPSEQRYHGFDVD
ncbi:C45 family peptidase [Salinisphaera sp. Q1T1-3]|uniref:C45 family autoproteolytic acyltransferase/hydolase n=1 Tax=Salinisphaera sp. Q1T1-3 TaxID=2321229 RepID=UPI000E72D74B|nr:C45 family peptidase [Salinisphaera sp. Q1T1-3]RJS93072.1 hypothetical protein D3260_09235 [Salinisphaera sp. Q1T1-3]